MVPVRIAGLCLPVLLAACAQAPVSAPPPETVARGEVVYLLVEDPGAPVVSSRAQHRLDTIRFGPGDAADVGSTAAGMAAGATEMNPMLSWAGPAAPLVAMPLKYGAKKGLARSGMTNAQANVTVETGSALGACANIATLAGIQPVAALATGAFCAIAYNQAARRDYQAKTGRRIDGRPVTQ